jgi:hypothetical protein
MVGLVSPEPISIRTRLDRCCVLFAMITTSPGAYVNDQVSVEALRVDAAGAWHYRRLVARLAVNHLTRRHDAVPASAPATPPRWSTPPAGATGRKTRSS